MPVNELQIGLVRGHSLAIRDKKMFGKKGEGSSDPLVVLSFKGRKDVAIKSTVREKTLCPAWAETFAVDLGHDEIREHPTLVVTCEDHDLVGGNDFMGFFEVPLTGLEHGRSRNWHELRKDPTKPKLDVSGELEIVPRPSGTRRDEARLG